MTKPTFDPPSHLSAAGAAFWRDIQREYGIVDVPGLKLLTAAAEALDAAEAARLAVAENGQTYEDRLGNIRPRPEVKIQRDALNLFRQITRELRLDPPEPTK